MKNELTSETKLEHGQTYDIAWALQELGKALAETRTRYAMNHVTSAIRNLNEFLGTVSPVPKITEAEGNISIGLHTYMRKCMDGPLSVILYRLISENRGLCVWYSFVKGLNENNGRFHDAIEYAYRIVHDEGHNTSDDLFMEASLRLWEDEFSSAWKWINEK